MKAKVIGIIGAVLAVVILLIVGVTLLMGGGESGAAKQVMSMDEIVEETIDLDPTGEVMVVNEGTVYWPVQGPGNSTDVIMITGIQVLVSWSDDEQPPASRPFYENTPDQMSLDVVAVPFLVTLDSSGNSTANNTIVASSRSDTGSTRIDLDLMSTPVVLSAGDGDNASFDPAGSSEPGNTGLYISVSCIAGNIEATRPALLMYTDRGDEVTLTVSISFKRVPQEVFEAWVTEQSGSDWV
ncbi:MAG: hypothetical protein ACMUHU_04035 [Thermoplasmatota archaeon]